MLNLDTEIPLIITVHGAAPINENSSIFAIKDAFLSCSKSNFLLFDWRKCSGDAVPSYSSKVANTKLIGGILADLINNFVSIGYPLESIQLIGFSMGGQIVGFAGKNLRSKYNLQLEHITSIDPSGAGFCDCDPSNRLSADDAKCVEVVHVSQMRGCLCATGTVDYYVNGGVVQPGCNETILDNPECSHNFGNHFIAEAICSNKCMMKHCSSTDCEETVDPLQIIAGKTACIQPGRFSVQTNPFGSEVLCKKF